MNDVLGVYGVSKWFGKVKALDKVSFNFRGGVLGLIGPNGSGKTTLINILSGLVYPSEGYATCLGYDCSEESHKIKPYIGVMLENESYPPYLDGYTYLKIVSKLYGIDDYKSKIAYLSKKFNMYTHLSKKIVGYSAGMRKKLSIMSALLNEEAKIIILDEPFADLDLYSRLEVVNIIKELYISREVNFIISSHIIREIEAICDYYLFLIDGRVKWFGPSSTITSKHVDKIYTLKSSDDQKSIKILNDSGYVREVSVENGYLRLTLPRDVGLVDILDILEKAGLTVYEVKLAESPLEHFYKSLVNRDDEN